MDYTNSCMYYMITNGKDTKSNCNAVPASLGSDLEHYFPATALQLYCKSRIFRSYLNFCENYQLKVTKTTENWSQTFYTPFTASDLLHCQ